MAYGKWLATVIISFQHYELCLFPVTVKKIPELWAYKTLQLRFTSPFHLPLHPFHSSIATLPFVDSDFHCQSYPRYLYYWKGLAHPNKVKKDPIYESSNWWCISWECLPSRRVSSSSPLQSALPSHAGSVLGYAWSSLSTPPSNRSPCLWASKYMQKSEWKVEDRRQLAGERY